MKRLFSHLDKDSAGRLSSTEDHRGWPAKQGTSTCSRRSECMGTREDFLSSKANKREQTRRLFYMPWVLQPELRHDLDTEVFIFALRHYFIKSL